MIGRRLEFVPPRIDEEFVEWSREQVSAVHFKPLLWTRDSPKLAGWYWVRFPGSAEREVVRVEDGFDFGPGLEWSSAPVPVPYESVP